MERGRGRDVCLHTGRLWHVEEMNEAVPREDQQPAVYTSRPGAAAVSKAGKSFRLFLQIFFLALSRVRVSCFGPARIAAAPQYDRSTMNCETSTRGPVN